MQRRVFLLVALLLFIWTVSSRAEPGIIITIAGNGEPGFSGDGDLATQASMAHPIRIAVDVAGNLFIAETWNHRIRKVDTSGIISTVAGNGEPGFSGDGGPATQASLQTPDGISIDAAGNLFISDVGNNRIRKVDTSGTISTVAGNGESGFSGDGGPATQARLHTPIAITVDAADNLFITDAGNNRIRKVDANGTISTVAGGGEPEFAGDGGPAIQASLHFPTGIGIDRTGDLLIADFGNNRIRRIDTNGAISTVAGNGEPSFLGDGGPATQASLNRPIAITVDAVDNLFIADLANNRIRKVDPNGVISTVAGNGEPGFSGDGGPATQASLHPAGICIDGAGNLLIVDLNNHRIRMVEAVAAPSPGVGIVSFVPDQAQQAPSDSTPPILLSTFPADSAFVEPAELEQRGIILVFDEPIDTTHMEFVLFRGNVLDWRVGIQEDSILTAHRPSTQQPVGFGEFYQLLLTGLRDRSGNAAPDLRLSFSTVPIPIPETISPGTIITVAGLGEPGFSGDGGLATRARLNLPSGIAVDAAGHLFIADTGNERIRKVDADGAISTVAGNGQSGFSGDGGLAIQANLAYPIDIAVDAAGNFFIADLLNLRIRSVDPNGIINTVAGNGEPGFSEDDGPATQTSLAYPMDIAVDAAGNLFIADGGNIRIRKVDSNGIISTVAGNGQPGFIGDGGPATQAGFSPPLYIAVDATGNLFISDSHNHRIRKVDANGIITTVAGNGEPDSSGDGGPATRASLFNPTRIAMDAAGSLFIADSGNNRIRKVDPNGTITTVAGNGQWGFSGDGGPTTQASLRSPDGLAIDAAGNLYITDQSNRRIRKVERIAAPTPLYAGTFSFVPTQTDTTPPALLSSFPADSSVVDPVELDRRGIILVFDEPLDTTHMEFDLRVDGDALEWRVVTEEDSILTVHRPPTQPPIDFGESYQFSLSGLRDKNGNALPEVELRFNTQAPPLDDTPLLTPNYPNPFNYFTTLPLQLVQPAPVRLDLFDTSGQHIAILIDGILAAGSHWFVWDGTNDRGQPVSTGVYLVRLQSGPHRQVRKIVRIK